MMEFKSFKDKQNHYKRLFKERGKYSWVSKQHGDLKGRTLVKPKDKVKEVKEK